MRASGKSTRLIDKYIQTLFNEGFVKVRDHYPTREADKFLFDRVVRRLKNEHDINCFDFNVNQLTIRLKEIPKETK